MSQGATQRATNQYRRADLGGTSMDLTVETPRMHHAPTNGLLAEALHWQQGGGQAARKGKTEREGAGIRDAHAWYSPGEVLITDHMPRNGRVPGWSHLGRDGVGRLVFNAAQVTQTGVMAYVVVSQG